MTEDDKYLFDLSGYLIVRNALTVEEVDACNRAIDRHIDKLTPINRSLAGESTTLRGSSRRKDLNGMLQWERPDCEPFRQLLCHPQVKAHLQGILGEGYRLDHGPGLIAMDKGAEGGVLHHGGLETQDMVLFYSFKNGRIFTGLTVIEYLLADERPGDGGVAVIPGSHKSNLPCPTKLKLWESYREHVVELHGKAGDAVIFTETLTHGTLPWNADHQRRALLYKLTPGSLAYSGSAHSSTVPDYIQDMTEEQRAVMEPPYIRSR